MGRRKIAIQPIPQERNRSVTFLKRKNGLFKKAYELGVLCSVDVAVIIFEERPGHHRKLYQYCSSDIHDIVQQHIRHDGERDTKGPADFSGGGTTKIEDTGDGDDDDGEDDDDGLQRTGKRSRGGEGSKLKLPSDMGGGSNEEYMTHRTLSMPQGLQGGPSSGSGLPISTLRTGSSGGPSSSGYKRRNVSRSPSDDTASNGPPSAYPYPGGPPSSNFGQRGGYSQQPQHHHHHHPPHGPSSSNSGGYSPFYNTQTPPQPPFMPLQPDFPSRGGPQPSRGGHHPGGGFGRNSGGSFDQSSNLYNTQGPVSMLRQSSSGSAGSTSTGTNPGSAGPADNLFDFLDQGQHPRQTNAAAPANFSLDWPVAGPGSSATSAASSTSAPPSSTSSAPGNNGDWLGFLANNANNPQNSTSASRETSGNTSSTISWERGGRPGGSVDRTTGAPSNDLADLFAAATASANGNNSTRPHSGSTSRGSPLGPNTGGHGMIPGSVRERPIVRDGDDGMGLNGMGMAGVSRSEAFKPKIEMKE